MFQRFFSQEYNFFDLFDRHAQTAIEGVKLLVQLMETWPNSPEIINRIKEIEHQCDTITHMTIDLMRRTYITPFERDEIRELISCLDDVIDCTQAVAIRFKIFQIERITPHMLKLARVLLKSQEKVVEVVKLLRKIKKAEGIQDLCREINSLENEGDDINYEGQAALFQNEKDPVTIIKVRVIYELLEEAVDRCEDVAHAVEGILIEHLG